MAHPVCEFTGALLEEESFKYKNGKICSITLKESKMDFDSNTEQVYNLEHIDTFI